MEEKIWWVAIGDNKLGIKKTPNGEVLNLCHGGIEEGIELINVHTKFELVNTKWDELKIKPDKNCVAGRRFLSLLGGFLWFYAIRPCDAPIFFFSCISTQISFLWEKKTKPCIFLQKICGELPRVGQEVRALFAC